MKKVSIIFSWAIQSFLTFQWWFINWGFRWKIFFAFNLMFQVKSEIYVKCNHDCWKKENHKILLIFFLPFNAFFIKKSYFFSSVLMPFGAWLQVQCLQLCALVVYFFSNCLYICVLSDEQYTFCYLPCLMPQFIWIH